MKKQATSTHTINTRSSKVLKPKKKLNKSVSIRYEVSEIDDGNIVLKKSDSKKSKKLEDRQDTGH